LAGKGEGPRFYLAELPPVPVPLLEHPRLSGVPLRMSLRGDVYRQKAADAKARFLDLSKGEADVAIRGGAPMDQKLVGRKIADVPWGFMRAVPMLNAAAPPREPRN
jgi:DNA-binding transcriptional LysR family regulator